MPTGDLPTGDMAPDVRLEASRVLYERALLGGDTPALLEADQLLDEVEADLCLARGRIAHGRFLAQRDADASLAREEPAELPCFERSLELAVALGDLRREAQSLFWVGCLHQVVRRDDAVAVPLLERAVELATAEGDRATASDGLRHLGIAAHTAGRLGEARDLLEASTAIRREDGDLAGVASNLVGLIYIARAEGRHDDAVELAEEARALVEASGADGVRRHVDEVRSLL